MVGHTEKVGGTPSLPQHPGDTGIQPVHAVDKIVKQTASEALSAAQEAGQDVKASKEFLAWLWGKKEDVPLQSEQRVLQEDEDAGTSLGGDVDQFFDAEDREEVFQDVVEDIEEMVLAAKSAPVQAPQVTPPVEDAVPPVEQTLPAQGPSPADKKEQLNQAAAKTQQVGMGWWQALKEGKILDKLTMVATSKIQAYAESYAKSVEPAAVISQSKQTMLDHLEDPRFIEFFDMVSAFASNKVESKIREKEEGFLKDNLLAQLPLVTAVVQMNLAKGFANLARQTEEQSAQIPNYDTQPSFVSVLSLISQKAGTHIGAAQLDQIEQNYRTRCAAIPQMAKHFFPDLEVEQQKRDAEVEEETKKIAKQKKEGLKPDEPKKRAPTKKELISKLIETDDVGVRKQIQGILFPDLDDRSDIKDIQQFFVICLTLHYQHKEYRHNELKGIFSLAADDVLSFLFPNRFLDMEIPGFLKWGGGTVAETIYSWFVKEALVSFMQETYESLEHDATRVAGWKQDLQARTGAPDLAPILAAPADFGIAFVKDFIQQNPAAVTFTTKGISAVVNPAMAAAADGKKTSEELLAELSHYQLANWLVESVQTLLHSEDPSLLGLGHFGKQALNNLTLALLAKGATLTIPEGDKVDKNQFLKELGDRIVAKLGSYKKAGATVLPDQFWKDLVNDLPIPAKGILMPVVVDKAKDLQSFLKDKTPDLTEIDKLYTDAETKIRGYKGGEELLSISNKVSQMFVGFIVGKPVEFVAAVGLGDTFEEMLTQYLPGVTIDDNLKTWFKDNLSALEPSKKGVPAKTAEMVKRGIQALVLNALVNTIETNFKNNSEDYAAQLLHNIHQAFIKSLSGFDESQREKLAEADRCHSQIEEKKKEIAKLSQEMADKPQQVLNPVQMSLIDDALGANMRVKRAHNYFLNLEANLEKTLEELNEIRKSKAKWERKDLAPVGNALVLRQMRVSAYPSIEAFKKDLKRETATLRPIADDITHVQDARAARSKIEVLDCLVDLLEMSPEELQLLSAAVHLDATIDHAESEEETLKEELDLKLQAVDDHALEKMNNRPDWEKAVEWLKATNENRAKLHTLHNEVKDLNKELDSHLKIFQDLAQELSALLGLDQFDHLKLPQFAQPFVKDYVWPKFEALKKENMARLLFEQLTPVILVIANVQENKDTLIELSKGDEFLVQLAASVSEEVVTRLSDFVTNYRPFAEQILKILSQDVPTEAEIDRMEAALRLVMIEAGRGGVTAAMVTPLLKGIVAPDKQEAVGKAITSLIQDADDVELPADDIFHILEQQMGRPVNDQKEHWEKQAKFLAHSVNELLINRGKVNLTPKNLLEAYQEQVKGRQKEIPDDKIEGAIQDLESAKVVDKIKTVFITHDEIAHALNEIIPGAKDLHTLIAPQLEAVIIGQDPALQANRKFVQDYIEGMLLQRFVKIGEEIAKEDPEKGILAIITSKLLGMVPSCRRSK